MSVFVEQQRPRCSPMSLVIDCFLPHTDLLPEFLHNLRLSDLFNLPGESVPMNPEIFSAMRAGNIDFLEKMRSRQTPVACLKNDKGDSILHLAAALGHHGLVGRIISEWPSLLLEPNWKDQIPLHAAAHAGFLAVMKILVASITHFSAKILSAEERERFNVYVLKDIDGDTPLHSALKGRHLETALYLVNASNHGSFLENNNGISPLYMAVEAGNLALVKAMLNGLGHNVQGQSSNLASNLQGKKSLVHAALTAKNRVDIIDAILNEEPSLVNEKDEEGQTCLSFGAYIGYSKGVCYLLDRSTTSVFECNSDGSFPIHIAVERGHVDVVKEILKRCPDSKELLNKQGQNILHVAAKSGKSRSLLLRHIKALDRKKNHLAEEQDEDGNTPLHLATINWRPRNVRDLTKFSSNNTKILNIKNKEGFRPLDIAELNLQSDYIFRERMTLMVLLSVYKPRGCEKIPTSGMTLRSRSENLDANKYKDRVNALLLVAALVATVTFAAGLTVPGGFNSSPPNLGLAILANDYNFIFFVVADIVAMHSSLVAIVALIWAQMGDPDLVHRAFRTALPSLSLALYSMSFAFYFGVLATTSHSYLLTTVINVVHSLFTCVFTRLLAPYVGPYIPSLRLCRWPMDTYIRILLRFVDEDVAEVHHTSGSGQTSV
ncbi:unnamed protein product [Eruca vesicaria subsp. sativa]|uniref:PGG domain-containing protein n=1 Tax=Eruca vesicaria subsp. sativa TaxID=29727 RepID=A0ABC8K1J1_ERUVS|nr:unnamed protein product [Eruca vesicaria subsp. sativa]